MLFYLFIRYRFVIIPDMLKNAPMFKNVDKSQRGAGEQAMKTRILRERIGRGRGSGNPQRGGWCDSMKIFNFLFV